MKRFDRDAHLRDIARLEPWLRVGEAIEEAGIDALERHRQQLALLLAKIMDRTAEDLGETLGHRVLLWGCQ